ncbi:hypothetical protein V8D89_004241 [Ganoderma adspersum]
MVVTEYLYKKFPAAISGQLSRAFVSVAVKQFGLHKLLFMNSVDLSIEISTPAPVLEEISNEDIVLHGWKNDPPEALSDVAAMVLEDLRAVLRPHLLKDPVSELMVWIAHVNPFITTGVGTYHLLAHQPDSVMQILALGDLCMEAEYSPGQHAKFDKVMGSEKPGPVLEQIPSYPRVE